MAASIIHAGEIPASQMSIAAATGIASCIRVIFMERAVVMQGTTMSATTAGLSPLNARSTHSLSFTCVKNNAIRSMMVNEGSMVPSAQHTAPAVFFSLYPTKIEMFTAKIPGSDCVTAKTSTKSSFDIQPLSTTSLWIRGSMAYPPPIVNIPILTKVMNSVQYIAFLSIWKKGLARPARLFCRTARGRLLSAGLRQSCRLPCS